MALIVERKRKDGSVAYVAVINIRQNGKWAHRESRSFNKRSSAEAWFKKRMKEIRSAGEDLSTIKNKGRSSSTAIDRYITESVKDIGRIKAQVLRSIKEYDIADMPCNEIKSHHIVQFAKDLGATRTPATVGNYMSRLGSIFAIARPAWGIPLDQQVMKDAFVVCNRLGITGKARKRNRRPNTVPMHRVVGFALFSTRRQQEITRLEWAGLDQTHSRVFIKDMKHPGEKAGNDVWCDLPSPAMNIALAMPKKKPLVFP